MVRMRSPSSAHHLVVDEPGNGMDVGIHLTCCQSRRDVLAMIILDVGFHGAKGTAAEVTLDVHEHIQVGIDVPVAQAISFRIADERGAPSRSVRRRSRSNWQTLSDHVVRGQRFGVGREKSKQTLPMNSSQLTMPPRSRPAPARDLDHGGYSFVVSLFLDYGSQNRSSND